MYLRISHGNHFSAGWKFEYRVFAISLLRASVFCFFCHRFGNFSVSFFETFRIAESMGELRICACLGFPPTSWSHHSFSETMYRALDSWSSNESSVRSSWDSKPECDILGDTTIRPKTKSVGSSCLNAECIAFGQCAGAPCSFNVL